MHRDLVLSRCGTPVKVVDPDLWDYLDFAVIFRENRVVQVVGSRLEREGKAFVDQTNPRADQEAWNALYGMAQSDAGDHGLLVSDGLVAHGQLPLLSLSGTTPFYFRLLPERAKTRERRRGLLLRGRLEQQLGPMPWTTRSRDLTWYSSCETLNLAADWLAGRPPQQHWTPLALRRALWECLHFGEDYWRVADFAEEFPFDRVVPSDSWQSDATSLRLLLVAQAYLRREKMRGNLESRLVAINRINSAECRTARHRLSLDGVWSSEFRWSSQRSPGPWEEVREPHALSLAAAQACVLDRGRFVHAILPREGELIQGIFGNPMTMGFALAGYWAGMPDWFHFGGAHELDVECPEHRFHAMATRASVDVPLCRHDRLLEVQETIRRLEEHGAFSPAERWTQVWCLGLPGTEEERELLRRIESFPHEDQPIPHFALGLEEMAKLARQWLPSCASFEQRRLARGLEIVLRLGLEALGLEARGLRA